MDEEPLGPLAESGGRSHSISALEDLASPIREAEWGAGFDDVEWYFDLACHTLLDDWGILEYHRERIGDTQIHIFRDEAEAAAVYGTATKLLALVERLGNVTAKHYVNAKEWPDIMRSAAEALALMKRP